MVSRYINVMVLLCSFFGGACAYGFCGYYVAKAGAELFNQATKVVYVRDQNRTVLSFSPDYSGNLKDFAMVVPIPEVLQRKQINVGSNKVIDHLDAYTAPRLVEYYDSDPCSQFGIQRKLGSGNAELDSVAAPGGTKKGSGVTIEARYQVGEYDILILSAKESTGLLGWLSQNGYSVSKKAKPILNSYIKQKFKFFVAKVNLKRIEATGYSYLRPLQMAYESKRFELPIRLGTVNAKSMQDIIIFALTRNGRVEPANYQMKKLITDKELPVYVKEKFGEFYKDMFSRLSKADNYKSVFLEYAWDMSWCDPCAADPLSAEELKSLGVFWAENEVKFRGGGQNVFVTRLHARYSAETFPEDISFQATNDRNNFQGRYVLRHPFSGKVMCDAAKKYQLELTNKREKRAQNLAHLTGWDINEIRSRMKINDPKDSESNWIDDLWKK